MTEDIPYLKRVGLDVKKYPRLVLKTDQVIIGRSRKATYTISSDVISRWHAVISRLEGNKWSIIDPNSLNGIHVNGHRLKNFTPYILQEGDFLQFGVSDSNEADFEYIFRSTLKKQQKLKSDEIAQNAQAENNSQQNENNQAVVFDLSPKKDVMLTKKKKGFKRNYIDHTLLIHKLNEVQEECAFNKHQTLKSEDVISDVVKFMNVELQCHICKNLLVKATTLNCSHTFCKLCIIQWMQNNDECPDCHTPITSLTQVVSLDNCMDKIVGQFNGRLINQGEDLVSVRNFEQSLLGGNSSSPLKKNRRKGHSEPLTRKAEFHKLATLKSATARRAAVEGTEASAQTLALKTAADLTRSAARRRTHAVMRFASNIKTAEGGRKIIRRRSATITTPTIGNVQAVARPAFESASTNVAAEDSIYILTSAPVDILSTTENEVSELTNDNNAPSNNKDKRNTSKCDSGGEKSDSSLSYSDEESGNSNMSSESSDAQSELSGDGQGSDKFIISTSRKGSQFSLHCGKEPMEDDHKAG